MNPRILALFLSAFTLSCGPGAALQPLVGETVDISEDMETKPEVLTRRAPDMAAERMIGAIRANDTAAVVAFLSEKTRRALTESKILTGDAATLQRAIEQYVQSGKSLETLLLGVAEAKVVLSSPRQIARGLQVPHSMKAKVQFSSADNTKHWGLFVLEDNTWKLQRSDFDQNL